MGHYLSELIGPQQDAFQQADAGITTPQLKGDLATPAGDVGVTPTHYQGNGLTPFEVIDAFELNFFEGNVFKYLVRWKKKNGLQDLYKARHYLNEQIVRAERAET